MMPRTAASSRRSSSRRRRSSSAAAGRVALDQPLDAARPAKMALVRAWAGPSWISWAMRARSASWPRRRCASGPGAGASIDFAEYRRPVMSHLRGRRSRTRRRAWAGGSAAVPASARGRSAEALRAGGPGRRGRPASGCLRAGQDQVARAGEVTRRGRATSAGGSSGRASVGTRCVSATQIGKLLMTGAGGRVEWMAGRGHARPELLVRAAAVPAIPLPNEGSSTDREQDRRAEDAERGPSHATGLAQRMPAAEARRCRRRSRGAADSDEQDVDRARRRGGTCPTRRGREQQARDEEHDQADRPAAAGRARSATLPRQGDQAEQRHRHPRATAGR